MFMYNSYPIIKQEAPKNMHRSPRLYR